MKDNSIIVVEEVILYIIYIILYDGGGHAPAAPLTHPIHPHTNYHINRVVTHKIIAVTIFILDYDSTASVHSIAPTYSIVYTG